MVDETARWPGVEASVAAAITRDRRKLRLNGTKHTGAPSPLRDQFAVTSRTQRKLFEN